jgi:hypothetical protein
MAANSNKVPVPHDRQTIVCLYCQQPMEISLRAINAMCKHCGKPLRFEDIRITTYDPKKRAVETYGTIVVEKKGKCWADRIFCGGMIVRGKVNGPVISSGPVRIGPKGEIKGDVTAPALEVDAGAVLEGRYRIGKDGPGAVPEAR